MAEAVEEARRRAERARLTGLFRYQLIQDVTDPAGRPASAARWSASWPDGEHDGPAGQKIAVSEQTIRRWVRDWRAGGFEALVPAPARVSARTPAEVLALAVALKKENPQRTAAQVTRICARRPGGRPADRTVQRHFERLELNRPAAAAVPAAAGIRPVRGGPAQRDLDGYALCRTRHNASYADLAVMPMSGRSCW